MPKKATDEQPKAPAAEQKVDQVEVKLAVEHPSGTHTVYLANTRVNFVEGIAKVTPEVADDLRKLGVIK